MLLPVVMADRFRPVAPQHCGSVLYGITRDSKLPAHHLVSKGDFQTAGDGHCRSHKVYSKKTPLGFVLRDYLNSYGFSRYLAFCGHVSLQQKICSGSDI